MSTSINYASTPLSPAVLLTTGDTSRTAPTTTGILINATSTPGAQVERLTIMPVATTLASVIRFFKYDGTNHHLFFEAPLAAQALAAGTAVAAQVFEAVDNPSMFPITIQAGWQLRVSVNDTQTGVQVLADAGGF